MATNKSKKGIVGVFDPDVEYTKADDVASVLKVLLKAIKRFKKEITDTVAKTVAQNKDELGTSNTAHLNTLLQNLDTREKELRALFDEHKSITTSQVTDLISAIRTEISEIRTLIPTLPDPIDLAPLDKRIGALESEVSIIRQAEDIRNRIELLQGDERIKRSAIQGIDELEEWIKDEFKKVVYVGSTPLQPSHWPIHERFTMDGVATTVTLQQGVAAQGTAIFGARYNGQTLDLGTHYTVDGNKITFVGFVPKAATIFSITYMP